MHFAGVHAWHFCNWHHVPLRKLIVSQYPSSAVQSLWQREIEVCDPVATRTQSEQMPAEWSPTLVQAADAPVGSQPQTTVSSRPMEKGALPATTGISQSGEGEPS